MRVAILVVLASLACAATAAADEPALVPPPSATTQPLPPGHGATIVEPPIVDDNPVRGHPRPSGYWTGYRPARGGAYRWRMLAIGAGVLAITGFFLIRVLRRASRTRLS